MNRQRQGERILGPYEEDGVWRVVHVYASGKRESSKFDSEAKAERFVESLRANLSHEEHTTDRTLTFRVRF